MTERNLGVTIDVKNIMMWHTVLCVDAQARPVAVHITANPLDHTFHAQVVVHKTRSHSCAVQVARYVRRRFGVTEPVVTRRHARAVEAMIGYACAGGYQHPPQPGMAWNDVVAHVAATPIKDLLKEVAGGHNASRTRYVVYEVRSSDGRRFRGLTHKFDALERRYREAPPDTLVGSDLVQVGRFATSEEAERAIGDAPRAGDHLWSKRPSPAYMCSVLRATPEDIVWTCDGSPALRRHYETPSVCVGPRVFTEFQVRNVLRNGEWPPNANSLEGMRMRIEMGE